MISLYLEVSKLRKRKLEDRPMGRSQEKKDLLIIALSIAVITTLHYLTLSQKWDIHDFYRRLYYIPIILAAFQFRLKGGVLSSVVIAILYAPHIFIYFREFDFAIVNRFLEMFMFIIIGGITGFLVEKDYKKKKALEVQVRKLTDLENFTQSILDSITNVLIAVDLNLKIQSINKEGHHLFDIDSVTVGRDIDFLFVEYKRVKEILKKVIAKKKKIIGIETTCKMKNEEEINVKLYAYPLQNIHGKIEGVVIVLEDITEIKTLENQIHRAEKLSAVGELASGIAHEIRNPLGIIKTIAQTMKEDIRDNDAKEAIEIILDEIDRANNVIKELLDFASPNIFKKTRENIGKQIKEILSITYKYAKQHGVNIEYTLVEDSKLLIDTEKIKQAFINIIFNSVQAMHEGGTLWIKISKKDRWIKIMFKDEGVGIPEAQLEKIYEPFYTSKDYGTGLGLAITHSIVEEHGGLMEIKSKVNEGTIVSVYLPVEDVKEENNG